MVLLEEENHPGVVSRHQQLIEHSVRFPPPVMLGLRELRLPVVTVQIRMFGVGAF